MWDLDVTYKHLITVISFGDGGTQVETGTVKNPYATPDFIQDTDVEDGCLNPKLFLSARRRGIQNRCSMGRGKDGGCQSTFLRARLQLEQNQPNMSACNMISFKYRL